MSSETLGALRYHRLDAYTALEVRAKYDEGDRAARIELLRSIFDAGGQLPYAVASAAVANPDITFRTWFAQTARHLDYSHDPSDEGERANLWSTLRTDPEAIVRLAVLENPDYDKYYGMQPTSHDFRELTHIERLAILRNPRWASNGVPDVVLSVFDTADATIVSVANERTDLAFAYLTNQRAVERSHRFDFPRAIRYDSVTYRFEKERERMWRLAAAFPDATVRWYAMRYLGAKDEWKASVYEQLRPTDDDEHLYENIERAALRYAILLNCSERDVQTLSLAIEDRDDDCAELARQKLVRVKVRRSKIWRAAGHVWVAVQNLIVIGAIIAVLSAAETRFEKILIAALVYLFLTLTIFSLQLFATYRATVVPLDSQFERVRKLLGERPSGGEAEAMAQQDDENRWTFAKANTNYVITSVSMWIAWLITCFALFSALLHPTN